MLFAKFETKFSATQRRGSLIISSNIIIILIIIIVIVSFIFISAFIVGPANSAGLLLQFQVDQRKRVVTFTFYILPLLIVVKEREIRESLASTKVCG